MHLLSDQTPIFLFLCVSIMSGSSELFDLSSSFTLGLPLRSSPLSFLSPCMAMMMARSWQTSSGSPQVARLVAKFGYEKPSVFLTSFIQKALMLSCFTGRRRLRGYRAEKISLYVVWWSLFLLLLTTSAFSQPLAKKFSRLCRSNCLCRLNWI